MEKFVILPDITCDLSEQIRDFFGLEEYVCGWVHINDRALRTTLDWSQISREEFYKTLASKKNKVTSATPSPEEYYQMFKRYAEAGYGILSMSISSTLSGTFSVASAAVARVKEEYPDAKIYAFDSYRMSGTFGVLVAYACAMKQEGKTMDEIIAWLEENKYCVHQMGPIDDLTFVARRGQISSGKAFMGNLMGIKPMGDCNTEGYVTVLAKVKGIKKALDATVEYVKRVARDPANNYFFIMHSDREEYANLLKEKLEAALPCKRVFISDVFAGCGTNIGPGMVGVNFLGAPVSAGCAAEKELLAEAIAAL